MNNLKFLARSISLVLLCILFICIFKTSNTYAYNESIGSINYPIGLTSEYKFTYESNYSNYSNNYKKIISFNLKECIEGKSAEEYITKFAPDLLSSTNNSTENSTWYVYRIKMNYVSCTNNDKYDKSLSPSTIFNSDCFCDKTGKKFKPLFFDSYEINSKKDLRTVILSPNGNTTFSIAFLLPNSSAYPYIKIYNQYGSLKPNETTRYTYLSLNPDEINKKNICRASCTISSTTYTGKARSTKYTLKHEKSTLKENKDFTVSYKNNVKPGVAIIRFKGIGNYEGIYEKLFCIKPSALKSLKTSLIDTTSIKLTWQATPYVSGYKIYKYNASTKKYSLARITTSNYAFMYGLTTSSKYSYKVYPYTIAKNPNTGKTLTTSSGSALYLYGTPKTLHTATRPNNVFNTKLSSTTKGTFNISWTSVENADGYQIMISDKNNFSKPLKTVYSSKTSVKVSGLSSKKRYYIAVRAYKSSGSGKVYSKTPRYNYATVK